MSKQLTAAERVAIARNPQRPNIILYRRIVHRFL